MTRQQIETIVSMYKAGDSYAKICRTVKKSEYLVKQWIRNNRGEYGLDKRRNLADSLNNTLSTSAWNDSKWNLQLGVDFIKRRWA